MEVSDESIKSIYSDWGNPILSESKTKDLSVIWLVPSSSYEYSLLSKGFKFKSGIFLPLMGLSLNASFSQISLKILASSGSVDSNMLHFTKSLSSVYFIS